MLNHVIQKMREEDKISSTNGTFDGTEIFKHNASPVMSAKGGKAVNPTLRKRGSI